MLLKWGKLMGTKDHYLHYQEWVKMLQYNLTFQTP